MSAPTRIPREHWAKLGHTVQVDCPGCGVRLPLYIDPLDHEVGPGGTVKPSLVCPLDDCGFHAYVTLEGWPG